MLFQVWERQQAFWSKLVTSNLGTRPCRRAGIYCVFSPDTFDWPASNEGLKGRIIYRKAQVLWHEVTEVLVGGIVYMSFYWAFAGISYSIDVPVFNRIFSIQHLIPRSVALHVDVFLCSEFIFHVSFLLLVPCLNEGGLVFEIWSCISSVGAIIHDFQIHILIWFMLNFQQIFLFL